MRAIIQVYCLLISTFYLSSKFCPPASSSSQCGIRKTPVESKKTPFTGQYNSYPWQAAILGPNKDLINSGALINNNHVLTTADRIKDYLLYHNLTSLKLRLGVWIIQNFDGEYMYHDYEPLHIFFYPKYNFKNKYHHNIAIIRLKNCVSIDTIPNINSICLPTELPSVNSRCYLAEWDENNFKEILYTLRQRPLDFKLFITDSKTCGNMLNYFSPKPSDNERISYTCARFDDALLEYPGEFGAPLVCQLIDGGQWYVHGLDIVGNDYMRTNNTRVYVNVYYYLKWINEILKTII